MEIQKIPAARLNPAAYNPRVDLKPGDKDYEKLKRSINEFGYVEPVIWNRQTGNVVDGTNGSRVLSIERSAEDITVVGNTFRGGGRGSWINQPYNLIMADNLFLENTRKCDPVSGRLCPDGGVESYPEIYFTTWEKNAKYGPVIFRGNIVRTMAHNQKAAIAFYDGGEDIILESNVFQGEQRRIFVGRNCSMPQISGNIGAGGIIREW